MLWLLDGHNILHKLPDIFAPGTQDDDIVSPEARSALLTAVGDVATDNCTCDIRVYFDGPNPSEQQHGPHLREIYSGGGMADQRADTAILEYIEFCVQRKDPAARVVVTDDFGLARRAVALGSHTMPVEQLAALLEDASCP